MKIHVVVYENVKNHLLNQQYGKKKESTKNLTDCKIDPIICINYITCIYSPRNILIDLIQRFLEWNDLM